MTQANQCALERALRVADQLCSGHATLRDEYLRKQFIFDATNLLVSIWLVAMVFVQPEIGLTLSPPNIPVQIWIGTLTIVIFFLNCMQFVTNWKSKAQAHNQAVAALSSFVKEQRKSSGLSASSEIDEALKQYSLITDSLVEIPEKDFLRLKRKHLLKVTISRHLREAPGSSILLLYFRIWLRDNFCKLCMRDK